MKNILGLSHLLLLAIFSPIVAAVGQWQLVGPNGGDVTAIAGNDSVLFIGTRDRGIYRSTDNAATWTATNNGLTDSWILALQVDGSSIVVGTKYQGIFWSSDQGANWQAASNGQVYPGGRWGDSEAYSFAKLGSRYFAGTNNGISVSTDLGRTWTLKNNDSCQIGPMITSSGDSLFATGTISASGGSSGVFESNDSGTTWQFFSAQQIQLSQNLQGTLRFAPIAVKDSVIFTAGYPQYTNVTPTGLIRSTNEGKNWFYIGNPIYDQKINCLTFFGQSILVGTDTNGIYISNDLGTSWVQSNTGLTNLRISDFLNIGPVLYAATKAGGVHRSIDGGITWQPVNTNMIVPQITSVAKSGKVVFAASYCGVFRSTDEGTTWTSVSNGLPEWSNYTLLSHGGKLFLGNQGLGMFGTTNMGMTWTAITLPCRQDYYPECARSVVAMCENGPDLFATSSPNLLLRSIDDGVTWFIIDNTTYFFNIASHDHYLFADAEVGHFPENPVTRLLRSSDNGISWTEADSGMITPITSGSFAEAGEYLFSGKTAGLNYRTALYSTTDDGESWQHADHGMPVYGTVTAMTASGTVLFAAAPESIAFSTDLGTSWTCMNLGIRLPAGIWSLVVCDTTLFAGTDNGIWKCSIADLVRGQLHLDYHTGWNIVSVPLEVPDFRRDAIYTTSNSEAFAYGGSYQATSVLKNGVGYWLRFNYDEQVTVSGTQCEPETIAISEGWNLIGSIGKSLPVSQIISDPPGIEISRAWGYYNGFYPVDTIWPGMGYWVKANENGNLILSSASTGQAKSVVRVIASGEQPPPLPDGSFDGKGDIPDQYTLQQNYPNPFNPTTVIRYSLPHAEHVSLQVFNVLGQLVGTLVNELQSAGYKEVSFDASSMTSGVYFCRLDVGSFVETKKLLLLK